MFALVDGSPCNSLRSCYGLGGAGAYGRQWRLPTVSIEKQIIFKTNQPAFQAELARGNSRQLAALGAHGIITSPLPVCSGSVTFHGFLNIYLRICHIFFSRQRAPSDQWLSLKSSLLPEEIWAWAKSREGLTNCLNWGDIHVRIL